ncbi:MAG: hypothetical protein R3B84_18065 [Zavarzinella sp.]
MNSSQSSAVKNDLEKSISKPNFQHFERVIIKGDAKRCKDFEGNRGTIIWLDSSAFRSNKNSKIPNDWLYIVNVSNSSTWKSFFESDLESLGCIDSESDHLGIRPEISFDLVMEDEHQYMEGSYRLPGTLWNVVIFKKSEVDELAYEFTIWEPATIWERAASGVVIRFPLKAKMGLEEILSAMTKVFQFKNWTVVNGPDSMLLR